MFVKHTSAYMVMPGGFGTLPELVEILTLIQTGKPRGIPVILMDRLFRESLIGWFRDSLARDETISETDLDLFCILDKPQEIVDEIFDYFELRG